MTGHIGMPGTSTVSVTLHLGIIPDTTRQSYFLENELLRPDVWMVNIMATRYLVCSPNKTKLWYLQEER